MVPLTELWLPIVLSAVAVFVMSSIIHMVLPYHKGDYKGLPNEDQALEALRPLNIPPGTYHFPHCSSQKDMNTPEFQDKMKQGPTGILTMMPAGMPNMGKYLGCWFLYCLAVSVFVAYLAGRTLAPGEHYLHVFRVAGTAAFLAFGMGHTHNSIWKGEAWGTTFKFYFDALIYACLTAGFFGWRWPQ
jgi:hypothetical protein